MDTLDSLGPVSKIAEVAANVGQAVFPLFGAIAVLFREIIVLAEKAGHNKRVCRRLAERVRVANQTLSQLLLKDENDLALKNYVQAITNCKDFIEKISNSGTFMKLVTAHEIETAYRDITEELDTAINQLGLTVCIRTNKDIEDDRKLFLSEIKTSFQVIEEVTKDLYDIGMDVQQRFSVFEAKLDTIHTAVDNVSKGVIINNKTLENSKIPSHQITDTEEEEVKRGHIVKKTYIMQTVAQKEIGHVYSLQKSIDLIEREVAILTELRNCQHIITFYGTMQRSGKLYIISEWAEMGDLNTYLKNHTETWNFKLRIASEIAGGLVFCHVCDILHHDIRSHNILLTSDLTAKISNFSSSRKESDVTTKVKDITLRYRWLAPEKLENYKDNEYTKQCDIYSFAIVLWELATQEVPFADVTVVTDLITKITSGERPPLIKNAPPAYEKIMQQGWQQRPIKRPTADLMFKELSNLFKSSRSQTGSGDFGLPSPSTPIISTSSRSDSLSSFDTPQSGNSQKDFDSISIASNYEFDSIDDSGQVNIQIIQHDVNEAKRLHNEKRYKEAWPIFKHHADKGNEIAEFYVGYYLNAGDRGVEQNKELAVEYLRRSAEKNVPDAQLRYGVALLNGEGVVKSVENDKIAVENLQRAAKYGNSNAMFNYGDLLINGAHGVKQDLEEGEHWMKQAHKKGHPYAYKKLADRYRTLGKKIPNDIEEGIRQIELK
ncbi:18306_t:CDS:2 [Dentiscutata erythropus]|uniref:18306_t:CDS:1 n=1 Tax=Dentiscutata erythropus TaxID=1348616 RepID=A0A9N9G2K8_9GLOM|nr:18306_t:CDS:2 [Dentiscutata erythropus]